ncbi:MAG: hypothetical protein IKA56_02120 [Clostridia bacterium]|nr:hypothetical protein [Clostridia bacterium]
MTAVFMGIVQKFISLALSVLMLLGFNVNVPQKEHEDWNTDYKYVMVHGLMGWGKYAFYYDLMPYWGMATGDMLERLEHEGFECYAASVAPSDSAWDRACELYAQLTGTVVDYGAEHSARCGHERYGTDYTGNKLFEGEWNETEKINLVGHSFGGATVRIFAHIMENGSETEKSYTTDGSLSSFFEGGKGDWIYSIITLAAPHNGTTAYEAETEPVPEDDKGLLENLTAMGEQAISKIIGTVIPSGEERAENDRASYDMKIDNALVLNGEIETLENVYYFSYPAQATYEDENGFHVPDTKEMEGMFVSSSVEIGKTTLVTEGGYVVDERWLPNDGLVNTYSARAPFNASQREYSENDVQPGVWNIMPVYYGNHMIFMGGLTIIRDMTAFFVDAFNIVNKL